MTRTASIAEAKDHLPELVHAAEAGATIEITRRGHPVAVLLSVADFERLRRGGSGDFWTALQAFREAQDLAGLDLDGAFAGVRDASAGREVSW